MPTQRPLMTRPTINMPIFCEAETSVEPTHLHVETQYWRAVRHNIVGIPDNRSNHDSLLPSQDIRNEARDQSTKPRSTGHGSSNTALHIWERTGTSLIIGERGTERTLVEVAEVLRGADDGRHG